MAFSVINNIGAIQARNKLENVNKGLSKTLQRLSSGLRINDASDDAAGLAIADRLKADTAALNQAVRNTNDGISFVQVADSVLSEVSNQLQRAVSLAEQAASDTSGADNSAAKTALGDEYEGIIREVNRISLTVDFNGTTLFGAGATANSFSIQVGASGTTANDVITISTNPLTASGSGTGSLGLTASGSGPTVTTTALDTKAGAQSELALIKTAIADIAARRGSLGTSLNRLQATASVVQGQVQALTGAESQLRDADIAQEVVNLSKFQVLNQTGLSALAQANTVGQSILALFR
ncbi:MAG: flagellin [Acidobacteria bacterium]|nr:flagellin [Acidobacteriota bacterium]